MTQATRQNKLTIPFLVSAGIILILLLIIIFRKPQVIVQGPDHTKQLRDSITLLTDQIEDEKAYTEKYKNLADSVMSLPPKVKIFYYEKRQFVTRATINQLDSLVRASSGLPVRTAH